jgi:hypothetical protein
MRSKFFDPSVTILNVEFHLCETGMSGALQHLSRVEHHFCVEKEKMARAQLIE